MKEMLSVLDETKETLFKDRKCTYPTLSGNIKELKLKSDFTNCHNTSTKPWKP